MKLALKIISPILGLCFTLGMLHQLGLDVDFASAIMDGIKELKHIIFTLTHR